MALLVGLGVVLHRLEVFLPLPSPWIKLGLANIMTLIALVFLGFKEAVTVTVLRVILGSMVGGTFLGPTFFLSLAGGLAGAVTMGLVYGKGSGPLSLVGVSVAAAFSHTAAIFFCVCFYRRGGQAGFGLEFFRCDERSHGHSKPDRFDFVEWAHRPGNERV